MMLRMIQQSLNPRLHKAPRPRVQRLLLTPHNSLRVGVLVEVFAQLGPRKGVQLLDACDGDVFAALGFAVLNERGVHLARAEDDAVDGVVGVDGAGLVRGVGDDPLEVGVADEIGKVRAGERMAEEGFREEDNEGCNLLA
jgi:hypothetical protein